MGFVPVPDVVQVEFRCEMDGQLVENRWHVDCLHEPTADDLTNIANNVATVLTNDWKPQMPADVTLREIHLRSLHALNHLEHTALFTVGTVGGLANPLLPSNVSVCVSLRSQFTGRSARGRLYWIGLTENDVSFSTISATRLTGIVAAVQAMIDALVAASFRWCIVSYRSGGIPRPGGPVKFIVETALVVDDVVDSQRRRLPGRGR